MFVLVVEDNPDLVANLCDFLQDRGHIVDVAYDGPAGLRYGLERRYDAVVLDLMLPGMDGLEVCRRWRHARRDTPVLMLTARDTLENKLEGFNSGTDEYLVKPFSLLELEARLEALVRRARGVTASTVRRVADLEFDPGTLEVRRAGRRIQLAPIPMRILDILMRQSPRVVPREEIEREVWGDTPPDSDALRAHVHLLRSAIDKPFDRPLLRTVRGMGYQLTDPDAVSA
jgi:DNA-binding response OmpR family regulator